MISRAQLAKRDNTMKPTATPQKRLGKPFGALRAMSNANFLIAINRLSDREMAKANRSALYCIETRQAPGIKPRVDWITEGNVMTAVARILLGSSYHRGLRIFSRFLLAVNATLVALVTRPDFRRERD